MLKFTVLVLVAVWLLSAIFGSRKRLIRDVNHLLQLIVWAALVFAGIHGVQSVPALVENTFLYGIVMVATFLCAWGISHLIVMKIGKKSHRS